MPRGTIAVDNTMPKNIRKGDVLRCLDLPRNTEQEMGFAIYPGDQYTANADSYMLDIDNFSTEVVELACNGDGEPETHYPVRFFHVTQPKYPKGTVQFSNFVRRQTPGSEFSHFTIAEAEVLDRITANWSNYKEGYRDGVILIPVNPDGFFSSVVALEEGDFLVGQYKARRPGETPRKSTFVYRPGQANTKLPAKQVDIVLYRADVLAENNERSTDAEWEVVSINANPVEGDMPIPVGALIANHFQLSGGTATNMTDSQFVAQLRTSVLFWADKSQVAPSDFQLPR